MELRAAGNKRLNQSSNKDIKLATIVNMKWRFQKNNDNGQIISYVQDSANKKYCYVSACKRIRQRVLDLNHGRAKPIVIFQDNKKYRTSMMSTSVLFYKRQQKVYTTSQKRRPQKSNNLKWL